MMSPLRTARVERCLSLREAALAMDVAWQTLDRAEQGLPIMPRSARKIAAFYELEPIDVWPAGSDASPDADDRRVA